MTDPKTHICFQTAEEWSEGEIYIGPLTNHKPARPQNLHQTSDTRIGLLSAAHQWLTRA
jgi:hypothetical protein